MKDDHTAAGMTASVNPQREYMGCGYTVSGLSQLGFYPFAASGPVPRIQLQQKNCRCTRCTLAPSRPRVARVGVVDFTHVSRHAQHLCSSPQVTMLHLLLLRVSDDMRVRIDTVCALYNSKEQSFTHVVTINKRSRRSSHRGHRTAQCAHRTSRLARTHIRHGHANPHTHKRDTSDTVDTSTGPVPRYFLVSSPRLPTHHRGVRGRCSALEQSTGDEIENSRTFNRKP